MSCNNVPETKENIVEVKLHTVKARTFQFPKRTTGRLSASEEVRLSFKTGGIIQDILVNEGDVVKKGALLTTLELSEIEANVAQAKAALDKAERDYERTQNLYNDSVVTREQLQNARTALEVAQSQLKIAEYNLRHSKITAPSDGTVLNILKEENELISPGYPALVFGSTANNWLMKVNITDKELVDIEIGDSASIFFDAYPNKPFAGTISTINKGADPYTNTYLTEIRLVATDKYLASGFIGKVDIFPSKNVISPIIPHNALLEGNERSGKVIVYSPEQDHEIREIRIKKIMDQGIVLESGLQEGENIITEGLHYVSESSKIKVINE